MRPSRSDKLLERLQPCKSLCLQSLASSRLPRHQVGRRESPTRHQSNLCDRLSSVSRNCGILHSKPPALAIVISLRCCTIAQSPLASWVLRAGKTFHRYAALRTKGAMTIACIGSVFATALNTWLGQVSCLRRLLSALNNKGVSCRTFSSVIGATIPADTRAGSMTKSPPTSATNTFLWTLLTLSQEPTSCRYCRTRLAPVMP